MKITRARVSSALTLYQVTLEVPSMLRLLLGLDLKFPVTFIRKLLKEGGLWQKARSLCQRALGGPFKCHRHVVHRASCISTLKLQIPTLMLQASCLHLCRLLSTSLSGTKRAVPLRLLGPKPHGIHETLHTRTRFQEANMRIPLCAKKEVQQRVLQSGTLLASPGRGRSVALGAEHPMTLLVPVGTCATRKGIHSRYTPRASEWSNGSGTLSAAQPPASLVPMWSWLTGLQHCHPCRSPGHSCGEQYGTVVAPAALGGCVLHQAVTPGATPPAASTRPRTLCG